MGRIEKSVEIKAPPEKVWEMLALDRMPEWKEGCKSVMFTSEVHTPEDKYRAGATARFIDKHAKLMMTVTDSLENEKITYRTSYLFVHRIDLTYVLELVEKETKLTYMVNYEMIGWGILGKVLFKLMMMASGKEVESSLENLKNILEK
ncbi:SRPBCC family protein [Candidatus Bathyarchaeota archaeon]|nr:SRPBCC family protein [Candidatus Bathyarchaeota archaeon]